MVHRFRQSGVAGSGFTLLELIIVLALLSLLVALVWPLVRKPLQRSVTQEAARQLMDDLARARLNAIETGRTMAVRYEPGGGRYCIVPADTLTGGNGSSVESGGRMEWDGAEGGGQGAGIELVIEAALKNNVVFRDPAETEEPDIAAGSTLDAMLADEMAETEEVKPLIEEEELTSPDSDTNWSTPILIYPTGRAENATFLMEGQDNFSVTVTLRGLTGAVSIGPLEQKRAPDDGAVPAQKSLDELAEDDANEPLSY